MQALAESRKTPKLQTFGDPKTMRRKLHETREEMSQTFLWLQSTVKSPPTIRLQSGWMLRTSSSQISEQDCQGATGVVGDLCEVSHPAPDRSGNPHHVEGKEEKKTVSPPRSFYTPQNLIFDS